MKKSNLTTVIFLMGFMVFVSCKKNEDATHASTPPDPTPNPTVMASLKGSWKATASELAYDDRASFSEAYLSVNADSTCTWTKKHKTNPSGSLSMSGKLLFESTGAKDTSGRLIDKVWFTFNKINGQDLSGSLHGIYQVNGSKLTLDWEFMRSGIIYPDPSKGFGSGSSNQKSISRYTKQ